MVAEKRDQEGGAAAVTYEALMTQAAKAERRLLQAELDASRVLDVALQRLARAHERLARAQARAEKAEAEAEAASTALLMCQEARAEGPGSEAGDGERAATAESDRRRKQNRKGKKRN